MPRSARRALLSATSQVSLVLLRDCRVSKTIMREVLLLVAMAATLGCRERQPMPPVSAERTAPRLQPGAVAVSEMGRRCRGDRPLRVSGPNVWPDVIRRNQPDVTECSGSTSLVLASGVVALDGALRNVRILKGTNDCVNLAVTKALKKWRFCPGEHNGVPVETMLDLTVNFHATPR